MSDTFAAAINCMDGRVQPPVIAFVTKRYGVNHVDMITEPGPNKILAQGEDQALLDSIKRRLQISVTMHGAKAVALFAHEDCAGNPATREEKIVYLKAAAQRVRSWGLGFERVETFWVPASFTAETITEI